MPKISLELIPKADGNDSKSLAAVESFRGDIDFVSVTCTKCDFDLTLDLCKKVQLAGHVPAAHFLCGGKSRDEIEAEMEELKAEGITKIVALRGETPTNGGGNGSTTSTNDFVRILSDKGCFDEICVAGYPSGHPESPDAASDLEFLALKIKAGATRVLTQVCFEPDTLLSFTDRLRKIGLTVPVSAGILPIRNYERMLRFADRCRAPVPKSLRDHFEKTPDEHRRELATGLLANLSERLVEKGMDLHYYTLNSMSMINESLGFLDGARHKAS